MTPDIESTLILHVGKNHAEVPLDVKKELLKKKKSRQVLMIVVNVVAVLFFSAAIMMEVSNLPGWVAIALGIVLAMNISLIGWQRKLINRALVFLDDPMNP